MNRDSGDRVDTRVQFIRTRPMPEPRPAHLPDQALVNALKFTIINKRTLAMHMLFISYNASFMPPRSPETPKKYKYNAHWHFRISSAHGIMSH
jgi:hypothetical protein